MYEIIKLKTQSDSVTCQTKIIQLTVIKKERSLQTVEFKTCKVFVKSHLESD